MKVYELITELEQYDENAEVRLAFQPEWPFEHSIDSVVLADPRAAYEVVRDEDGWYVVEVNTGEQVSGHGTENDARRALDLMGVEPVVYIGEGRQLGYLPSAARAELCWR
jgi:hypothetical protein